MFVKIILNNNNNDDENGDNDGSSRLGTNTYDNKINHSNLYVHNNKVVIDYNCRYVCRY